MKKWAVIKITNCDIPESWYYSLVGQKIRILLNTNNEPRVAFYQDYKYYTAVHNRCIIDVKDTEIQK